MIATLEQDVETTSGSEKLADEALYEIIDGKRVELPPMSILASRIAANILLFLSRHVFENGLGQVLSETLFRLPLPVDRNRRPDVVFVSAKTIAETPEQSGSDNAWAILPDLMVEVVSPTDRFEELVEKIDEYFSAGTKLVWLVFPTRKIVYVYESPRQVRILGEPDELHGGAVLPDFRIPISSLFRL
jgi:Uma2 family endonuclease